MNKVLLVPKMELLEGLGLTAYNTVEAEYGDQVIEAIGGGVTLAHHGSRSSNPAPCIAEVTPNDLPILISHVDLDTIGGIMALCGQRDMSDDTAAAFWALAAYVDCHGPHRLHEANAPEKIVRRLNAWYAWSNDNRAARADGVVDMTDYVRQAVGAVKEIIAGDAAMIVAGEEWRQTATEQVEARLVDEDERVRVFVTDGVFCSAAYYSPKLDTVVKATVALNTQTHAISIAFEDSGREHHAGEIAQALWGKGAGGHAGIAGSPRGKQMTRDNLDKAVAYVRGLYAK